MQSDMPIGNVAAIASIVAALITGAIAFINLTLSKEIKTSEFRQVWIDALRIDLAVFFAGSRAMTRAMQENASAKDRNIAAPVFGAMTREKISEIRYQAAETYYSIRLRLNMEKAEHKELLRLMKIALDELNELLQAGGDVNLTLAAIDGASEYAPQILKKEWERVKAGELPFRVARNYLAPIVFVVPLLVVIFLSWGNPKSEPKPPRGTGVGVELPQVKPK